MAGPGAGMDWSYNAEVALASYQYRVVVQGTADGKMTLPAAAGAGDILGVLQDKPAILQEGNVRKSGISFVIAGDTITRGDALEIADALGRVRKVTSSAHAIVGIAEQSAVVGDRFTAWINIIPMDDMNPGT